MRGYGPGLGGPVVRKVAGLKRAVQLALGESHSLALTVQPLLNPVLNLFRSLNPKHSKL
jgi:hypothetical protein